MTNIAGNLNLCIRCITVQEVIDRLEMYNTALTEHKNEHLNSHDIINYVTYQIYLKEADKKLEDNDYTEKNQIALPFGIPPNISEAQKIIGQHLDAYKVFINSIQHKNITYTDYLERVKLISTRNFYIEQEKRLKLNMEEKIKKGEELKRKKEEEERIRLELAEKRRKELMDKELARRKEIVDYYQKTKKYHNRCKKYIASSYDDEKYANSDDEHSEVKDETDYEEYGGRYFDKFKDIDINDIKVVNDIEYIVKEMKNTIKEAHEKYNESLLEYTTHEGCGEESYCVWTYNAHRCSCDNYKGFTWSTEYVDWLKDIDLDSSQYVGSQDRQW
jgi:hypothetical protein